MRLWAWLLVCWTAGLLALGATVPMSAPPVAAQAGGGELLAGDLAVSLSESGISAMTGDTVTFVSEIANTGGDSSPPLIAHLNIASLDQSAYVDPEDWSPQRTITVDPIAAGSSSSQSWTVNPVLAGEFAVYVVVLPSTASLATADALSASPAIHLQVDEKRSLNPGGVLPVVLAVPIVLAIGFAGLRTARNRR